jgi:hypothetical protein
MIPSINFMFKNLFPVVSVSNFRSLFSVNEYSRFCGYGATN